MDTCCHPPRPHMFFSCVPDGNPYSIRFADNGQHRTCRGPPSTTEGPTHLFWPSFVDRETVNIYGTEGPLAARAPLFKYGLSLSLKRQLSNRAQLRRFAFAWCPKPAAREVDVVAHDAAQLETRRRTRTPGKRAPLNQLAINGY
jgi:hypothetical protein